MADQRDVCSRHSRTRGRPRDIPYVRDRYGFRTVLGAQRTLSTWNGSSPARRVVCPALVFVQIHFDSFLSRFHGGTQGLTVDRDRFVVRRSIPQDGDGFFGLVFLPLFWFPLHVCVEQHVMFRWITPCCFMHLYAFHAHTYATQPDKRLKSLCESSNRETLREKWSLVIQILFFLRIIKCRYGYFEENVSGYRFQVCN